MWGLLLMFWLAAVTGAVFVVVPHAEGLGYFVRIAFFHIPTAWVSVLGFFLSAWWSARYIKTKRLRFYRLSASSAKLGLVFCLLATASGAVFAKLTWGAYWNWDPRQTTIFILLLIYGAYVTLGTSIEDEERRAKVSSVYALLSFVTVPFLVFIIPRFFYSLHPEPILNSSGSLNMDATMLWVLMAALAGCTGLFAWLLALSFKRQDARAREIEREIEITEKPAGETAVGEGTV